MNEYQWYECLIAVYFVACFIVGFLGLTWALFSYTWQCAISPTLEALYNFKQFQEWRRRNV